MSDPKLLQTALSLTRTFCEQVANNPATSLNLWLNKETGKLEFRLTSARFNSRKTNSGSSNGPSTATFTPVRPAPTVITRSATARKNSKRQRMSPLSIGGKEVGFEPPPSPEIARQSLPDDQFELSVLDPDERAFSTSSEKDEDNDEDVTSKFFHNNRFEALQQEQISTSYIEAQNNSSVSEKNCLHKLILLHPVFSGPPFFYQLLKPPHSLHTKI